MKKLILSAALGLCMAPLAATATTISYTDFSDVSDFTLNGTANSLNPNSLDVLRLTNNLSQSGSAFLTDAVSLTDGSGFEASFSSYFQFRISDNQGISDSDGQGADGITFVIQTNASNVGGSGGGIGYQGIDNSVGIEFDTWNNGSIDDYSGNHVGINLNGNVNSVVQTNVSPRMNNGAIWNAWVDYNGDTDDLEVRLSDSLIRPGTASLSYNVDLVSVLGVPDSYIGFTSGTGAAGGDHDILNWQFTNTFNPIDPTAVMEPGVLALFGLGFVGLAARRRKS